MNDSSGSENGKALVLKDGEDSDFIGKLFGVPFFGILVLAIAVIVRLIQRGPSIRYWLLLGGGLLSILILFGFSMLVARDKGEKKKGLFPMFLSFSVFVPYLYGCYLCFYEGLWRLVRTFSAFSLWSLALSLLFMVLGFNVVSATYKTTEFGRKIDAGIIRIEDSNKSS
jgi:cytochrome bd-type quinol oxidase subunit 1